jgi:ammonia channel protein AmtB
MLTQLPAPARAGLVGITSPCAVVEHYAAVIIGIASGFIMLASSKALKACRIDDPLDSVPVHFACGIWCARAPAALHACFLMPLHDVL